jgi:hypothetical protein
MKTAIVAAIALAAITSTGMAAGPAVKFRPESYAVHQMHSHHLAATHHAHVLEAYSGDAASIPHAALQDHVELIRREVMASSQSLGKVPSEMQADVKATTDVKAIQQSHADALQAVAGLSTEIAKPQPNYQHVQQHARRMVKALHTGESHIHNAHARWQMSTIHRRLRPGEK